MYKTYRISLENFNGEIKLVKERDWFSYWTGIHRENGIEHKLNHAYLPSNSCFANYLMRYGELIAFQRQRR